MIATFLPHAIDMRKGVNAALKTKYESKEWKKWFVDTAKRLMEKLDAESEDGNVRVCSCNYISTDTNRLRVAFRLAALHCFQCTVSCVVSRWSWCDVA